MIFRKVKNILYYNEKGCNGFMPARVKILFPILPPPPIDRDIGYAGSFEV